MAAQNFTITGTDSSSNGTGPYSVVLAVNTVTQLTVNTATTGITFADAINRCMERVRNIVAQTFNSDPNN